MGLREGKMSTQTLSGVREGSLQGHSIELQGVPGIQTGERKSQDT